MLARLSPWEWPKVGCGAAKQQLKKKNSIHVLKSKTVNFECRHNLVYHGKCPANNCNNDYVGDTGPHISERIMGHNGRDINSHLLKHHIEKQHQCLQIKDCYS